MKIIKKGYLNDKGIEVSCLRCGCIYIIENRKDWITRVVQSYLNEKYIEYNYKCPMCGNEESFGIDPNVYNDGNLLSLYQIVFDRPDWKEKFEVKLEDI